jgi:hypothetical protein
MEKKNMRFKLKGITLTQGDARHEAKMLAMDTQVGAEVIALLGRGATVWQLAAQCTALCTNRPTNPAGSVTFTQ